MKLSMAFHQPCGDLILINIDPVLKKAHWIKVERVFEADKSRQISRFLVDSEQDAWDALIFMLGGEPKDPINPVNPKIHQLLKDNKVGELLS